METIVPTETRTELPFGQSHAFIIGIDEYEQVSPLQTAVSDARKLAEVLALNQHFRVYPPLLNAKAAEIRQLLEKTLAEKVDSADRVFFYFAGHGIAADGDDGPAGYLVPADADPTDVKTFIPMEDLHTKLDALPCRHLLLVLDCCFSGAFKWSSQHRACGTLMPKKIYKERFDRFIQEPAWQVLTSAAYDQKALDVLKGTGKPTGDRGRANAQDGAHSPFALALFEGLAGTADFMTGREGDGVITVTELYAYIRDQIEPASIKESQKLRQTPSFFPLRKHDKGEFIFLHPRHRLNLPARPKRNPYKGLQSFDEADKELFYGRDRVIKEMRAKAESNKLLVVSGASGTGKSSVIKAGLLPVLREAGFRILPVIRPGVSPMASLEKGFKEAKIIEENATLQNGAFIAKLGESKTVLLIDQYEELITRCPNPAEREQFDALLRKLLNETPEGILKLILTVRADFEPQLDDGALKSLWMSGRCTVPPFNIEELKEVVVMPTIQEVLIFDPPELVDEIIEEVVQAPGALPLLSYTLSELYEAHIKSGQPDHRVLKKEDYTKLGGVMGALRTKADLLYQSLEAAQQNTMRKIILRMVSLEGDLAGKRVMMDDLIYAEAAENQRVHDVVDKLVDARLVVKGKDYIEPAHDALVRAWGTLHEWKNKFGTDTILLQQRLSPSVSDYAAHMQTSQTDMNGEDPRIDESLLWHDDPRLEQVKKILESDNNWLNKREENFIRLSLQKKDDVIAQIKRKKQELEEALRKAQSELARNYYISALNAREQGDQLKAAHYLARSGHAEGQLSKGKASKQIFSLYNYHDLNGCLINVMAHERAIVGCILNDDHNLILTYSDDGTARLWHAKDGSPAAGLMKLEKSINGAQFNRDASLILTWSEDGTARLWHAKDGSPTAAGLMKHDDDCWVSGAQFNHDESLILTWSNDGTARLWHAKDGSPTAKPMKHKNSINDAQFNRDGKFILTRSVDDHTVRLWNAKDGSPAAEPMQHNDEVWGAQFNRDESLILTWSNDSTARLWHVKDGSPAAGLMKHDDDCWVSGAQFNHDESLILTWSDDGKARLWHAKDGSPAAASMKHEKSIQGAQFNHDESLILTWSDDGKARLWHAKDGSPAAGLMKHEKSIQGAQFNRDASLILTWSSDGAAKLWHAKDGSPAAKPMKHDQSIRGAQFNRYESLILTWSYDGTARLWHAKDGSPATEPMQHNDLVWNAQFNRDESLILTWSKDGTARLWHAKDNSTVAFSMKSESTISGMQFNHDETLILTWGENGTARLWHAKDGSPATEPMQHQMLPRQVGIAVSIQYNDKRCGAQFNRDETLILTWSIDSAAARLWHAKDGSPAAKPMQHNDKVWGAQFSRDENLILTWSDDGTARLWHAKDGSPATEPMKHDGWVSGARFNRDESLILTCSYDKTARLWNAKDGSPAAEPLKHDHSLHGAQFNRDESLILTWGGDNTARLWHAKNGVLAAEPMKHNHWLSGVQFNRDESLILTCSIDGTARLWHAKDGSSATPPMKHNRKISGARFNHDESLILTWSDDDADCTARLWYTKDGAAAAALMKHDARIVGAQFNVDGSLILTWSHDGTARLWNAKDGSPAAEAMKHDAEVFTTQFNRDESLILTWSGNGIARLWPIKADNDFPLEHLPLLAEIVTGTTMDVAGNIQALKANEWQERKQAYLKIAEGHWQHCQYRDANLYAKQKRFWEGR